MPDLLTDDGTITEFYEIKPNSPSGIVDGIEKVTKIGALMGFFNLPYVPGTKFNSDKKVLIFKGIMFEIEVKVFFHFFRLQAGLIVYDICVEAGVAIEDIVAKAIIGAIVLIVVFGPEILAAAAAAAAAAEAEAAAAAAMAAAWAAGLRLIPGLAN